MIDALGVWKSTLESLPKVSDGSWAMNFANWYAQRIAAIMPDPSALVASGFVYTFPVAAFASALQALSPTEDAEAGISGFADAWEAAKQAIVFPASLSVASGSFVPPTSPATLFSVVNSVLLEPASITSGKSKVSELGSADPTAPTEFPAKFRDATLELKITVSGLDSTPPTGGPLPLTASNVPLT